MVQESKSIGIQVQHAGYVWTVTDVKKVTLSAIVVNVFVNVLVRELELELVHQVQL